MWPGHSLFGLSCKLVGRLPFSHPATKGDFKSVLVVIIVIGNSCPRRLLFIVFNIKLHKRGRKETSVFFPPSVQPLWVFRVVSRQGPPSVRLSNLSA